MMGRVYALALNTFREATRQRVVYAIVVAAVFANLFALVLGQMSLHEEARVARDVGLASVSLFGAATAILLGVSLLHTEIERRTVHVILAKPVERAELVAGKYLGMVATLTLLVVVFTAALAGLLVLARVTIPDPTVGFTGAVAKAVLLAYFEVCLVAALAVFFSSFSSPFLSGCFTFALFFLGRIEGEVRLAVAASPSLWIRSVAGWALRIVPDLTLYSVSGGEVAGRHVSIHGDFVSWWYVEVAAGHALAWIALLIVVAMAIFERRDFA